MSETLCRAFSPRIVGHIRSLNGEDIDYNHLSLCPQLMAYLLCLHQVMDWLIHKESSSSQYHLGIFLRNITLAAGKNPAKYNLNERHWN